MRFTRPSGHGAAAGHGRLLAVGIGIIVWLALPALALRFGHPLVGALLLVPALGMLAAGLLAPRLILRSLLAGTGTVPVPEPLQRRLSEAAQGEAPELVLLDRPEPLAFAMEGRCYVSLGVMGAVDEPECRALLRRLRLSLDAGEARRRGWARALWQGPALFAAFAGASSEQGGLRSRLAVPFGAPMARMVDAGSLERRLDDAMADQAAELASCLRLISVQPPVGAAGAALGLGPLAPADGGGGRDSYRAAMLARIARLDAIAGNRRHVRGQSAWQRLVADDADGKELTEQAEPERDGKGRLVIGAPPVPAPAEPAPVAPVEPLEIDPQLLAQDAPPPLWAEEAAEPAPEVPTDADHGEDAPRSGRRWRRGAPRATEPADSGAGAPVISEEGGPSAEAAPAPQDAEHLDAEAIAEEDTPAAEDADLAPLRPRRWWRRGAIAPAPDPLDGEAEAGADEEEPAVVAMGPIDPSEAAGSEPAGNERDGGADVEGADEPQARRMLRWRRARGGRDEEVSSSADDEVALEPQPAPEPEAAPEAAPEEGPVSGRRLRWPGRRRASAEDVVDEPRTLDVAPAPAPDHTEEPDGDAATGPEDDEAPARRRWWRRSPSPAPEAAGDQLEAESPARAMGAGDGEPPVADEGRHAPAPDLEAEPPTEGDGGEEAPARRRWWRRSPSPAPDAAEETAADPAMDAGDDPLPVADGDQPAPAPESEPTAADGDGEEAPARSRWWRRSPNPAPDAAGELETGLAMDAEGDLAHADQTVPGLEPEPPMEGDEEPEAAAAPRRRWWRPAASPSPDADTWPVAADAGEAGADAVGIAGSDELPAGAEPADDDVPPALWGADDLPHEPAGEPVPPPAHEPAPGHQDALPGGDDLPADEPQGPPAPPRRLRDPIGDLIRRRR